MLGKALKRPHWTEYLFIFYESPNITKYIENNNYPIYNRVFRTFNLIDNIHPVCYYSYIFSETPLLNTRTIQVDSPTRICNAPPYRCVPCPLCEIEGSFQKALYVRLPWAPKEDSPLRRCRWRYSGARTTEERSGSLHHPPPPPPVLRRPRRIRCFADANQREYLTGYVDKQRLPHQHLENFIE